MEETNEKENTRCFSFDLLLIVFLNEDGYKAPFPALLERTVKNRKPLKYLVRLEAWHSMTEEDEEGSRKRISDFQMTRLAFVVDDMENVES